jgi:hypothetical protein
MVCVSLARGLWELRKLQWARAPALQEPLTWKEANCITSRRARARRGSVYSEPGGVDHFAQTSDTAVIVQISGYGPTDMRYFDPANDPSVSKSK